MASLWTQIFDSKNGVISKILPNEISDPGNTLVKKLALVGVLWAGGAYLSGGGAGAAGAEGAGAGAGAAGAGVGTDAAMGSMLGLSSPADIAAAESGIGGGSLAEGVSGVSASGQGTLLADAGTGMTDVSPGLAESVGGVNANPGAALTEAPATGMPTTQAPPTNFPGEPTGQYGGPTGMPTAPAGGGILNSAMKNPLITYGAMQGVGNALMNERKIKADQELLKQKYDEEKALQEWKRRFVQGGAYFSANNGVSPKAGAVLRRPSGEPVYNPNGGIITSAMG